MPLPLWYTFPLIYSQLEMLDFEEPEVLLGELRGIRCNPVDLRDAGTVLCTVQRADIRFLASELFFS